MIYLSVFITKRKCNMPDIKDFKKAYISACPKWLMLSTGAVVIYTFAGLISLVYGKYFGVSISTNNVDHIAENYNSFSGYLMAFYALPFSILYSINKYIKEIENDK